MWLSVEFVLIAVIGYLTLVVVPAVWYGCRRARNRWPDRRYVRGFLTADDYYGDEQ